MKCITGKFLTTILLALTCGCLAGCQDTGDVQYYDGKEDEQEQEISAEEAVSLSAVSSAKVTAQGSEVGGKSEIMLVERSTNYAWGHHDHGLFVDTQGKVYAYDFSRYPMYMAYDENALTFVERLEIIRENSDPVAFFDEKDVESFMELGEKLSAKDEFNEKEKMYDYGQNTLYFYRPKTQELLKVKSTGDVDCTPKNENAKKIAQKYESYMWWHGAFISEAELDGGIPTVYSLDDVTMLNYAADGADQWIGKWALDTKDQLKKFAEQSGIPVDGILADDKYPNDDEFTYYLFVEEAGQKENKGNPRAFWMQGNCIDFLCLDGASAEEGAFVCHLAVICKEDLFGVAEDIYDLNGTAWKKF